jgi:hypothetical protein
MERKERTHRNEELYFRFLVLTVAALIALLSTVAAIASIADRTAPAGMGGAVSRVAEVSVHGIVIPGVVTTPTPTRCPVPPGCLTSTATPTCPPGVLCDTPTATPTCHPGQCDTPTATPTSCGAVGCSTPTATPCGPPPAGCATDTPTPTPTCPPGVQCGSPTPTSCGAVGCSSATPTATPTCPQGVVCGTATPTRPTRTRTPTNTSTNTVTRTPTNTRTRTPTSTPTCIILGHYTATIVVGTVTIIPATQDLGNHCNDCLSQLIFPFPAQFYGDSYGKAVASSNGNVQFVPESTNNEATCLPNQALDTAIMLYQGDLDTSGQGEGIFSATLGTAPNRTFVLEWRAHYAALPGTADAEMIFYENSPTIRMVYGPNGDNGQNEVSGVQRGQDAQFSQYSCHQPLLTAGKAIDWGWTPAIIICTPTPTRTATRTPTATPTACIMTIISNGFESGTLEGYTSVVATCVPGGCGWTNVTTAAHTGVRSLFAPDVNEPSDQQLTSPAFTVPTTLPKLTFWHRYALEHPLWDGGELEISPNGGPWVTVTPSAISPTYPPGVIPGTFSNPLVGKNGWTDKNPSWPGWDQVTVNLSAYAGIPNTRFRFRLGTDHGNMGQGPALGWWIDDITVTGPCATATPTITRTRTPTPTPTLPCVPTPDGLTHWYPLDETSGSIANEIIFGGNAFEINGPAHVPGKVAGGLNFNGVNQWAGVFPPSNSPQLGTGDFTIDTWISIPTSSLVGTQVFLDGRNFAPRGYAMFLFNGKLALQLGDLLPPPNGYSNYIAPTQGGLANPGWHFVAATVRRITNGGTLWVDGVPLLTFTPRLGNLSNNAPLWIGRHHPNAYANLTSYFRGSLDEIEFFRRALTPTQVLSIYNAGAGGKCKPTPVPPTATPTPGPCPWCSTDVPVGSTFYLHVTNLVYQGVVTGYPCGGPNEPCVPPGNYNYYRPGNNVTRGQISKLVALSAGFNDTPTGQSFEDVPPSQTFYVWIEQLSSRALINGYPCGSPGEPCNPPGNLPYYRPGNNVTRGQAAKIVANTFWLDDWIEP